MPLIEKEGLFWAVNDAASVDPLCEIAMHAAAFASMNIKHASGAVSTSQTFEGENGFFPHEKRLTTAFLTALQRSPERTEMIEGVPDVTLEVPLQSIDPTSNVTMGGENVDQTIFGSKRWEVKVKELQRLEGTTRIGLSSEMPPRFYAALMKITTALEHQEFFSLFRSVELFKLPRKEVSESMLATLEASLANANDDIKGLADTDLWERYVADTCIHTSLRGMDYVSNGNSNMHRSVLCIEQFLSHVISRPQEYGFKNRLHSLQTFSLSLTELCTGVCISQEGYYFVDGCGETMNQLCERTPDPVVFLSAPGLDFCTPSTTRLEMPKYFEEMDGTTDKTELKLRWKGFKEGGEQSIRKRVKNLYRVVLTSAKMQHARNPSMLPMGLGVFLYNVNKADHDGVREAYFRAQFELLTEEDWGFETYWLNPAQHRGFAEELLRKGIESGEFRFKCNVVLHNRDAKFLAVEMAKRCMRPAVLNPSDCVAVMQGLIGYFWELGRGDRYVGEEDFAATGTGILARCGISDVYTDLTRIVQVETDSLTNDTSCETHAGVSLVESSAVVLLKASSWTGSSIQALCTSANPFSQSDIMNATGRRFNAGSFDADRLFPVSMRPAATFLELLGRDANRYEVVEGVPHVSLLQSLAQQEGDKDLTLCAAEIAKYGDKPGVPTADIFGVKEFSISHEELHRLERTTRVLLTQDIPPQFYVELCRLTTDATHAKFFSYLRSVPLGVMSSECEWDSVVEFAKLRHQEGTEEVQKMEAEGGDDWDRYVSETSIVNSAQQMQYFLEREAGSSVQVSAAAWEALLSTIRECPRRHGFVSEEHLAYVFSLSLTELCTGVCISQEGYYFVDGCGETMNQLCERTPDPVVFLSAPGLDFCTPSTTRLEMPKYFEEMDGTTDKTELKLRWKGFKEGGEQSIRKRVKNLYRVVLTSAKMQHARNPSMLPMGLGVFLYNVNKADHDGVREAYFRAQFELLTEEDWGFETYWLNPAQHRGFAEELLRKGIESGEFRFKCNVVLHNRDAKFLAVEMAKRCMRPAVLNPSDCVAVMQGLIGYFWELGRGDRYVGEEDFAATGTGILARCGISDVYTDLTRIVQVETGLPVPAPETKKVAEVSQDGFAYYLYDSAAVNSGVHSIAQGTATFQYMNIRGEGKTHTYNPSSFLKEKQFNTNKRLTSVFLELLGRSTERELVVEGVPNVVLSRPLVVLHDSKVLTLDAASIERMSTPECPSGEELWGRKAFSINIGEVKRLERTTRVALTDIPPAFYARITQMATDAKYAEFFSILRSVPLRDMLDPGIWDGIVVQEEHRRDSAGVQVRQLKAEIAKKVADGEGRAVDDIEWDLYIEETAIRSATCVIAFLGDMGASSIGLQWDALLTDLRYDPCRYGFDTAAALEATLLLSLTELCTGVCISQEGYYFVDGCGETMNQLCERTPDPVVFLSAPGLDFCTPSTTRLEMPKYFEEMDGTTDKTELKLRWKGFKEGGEQSIRKRVKNLYRVVLTSAKMQHARNPSMLPMGLGVFLYNVNKADHDGVREAYFRAQFELLTEEDWGFETYWLNPAQHRGFAEELLRKGIESGEFRFKCNVVLHNRDAKFLAVEMAKRCMRPAVLNPSDCVAVMQGLIGYFWELGRGDRYVGEEDFAATGTGILARCGISDVYTDLTRIVQVTERIQQAKEDVGSDQSSDDNDEEDCADWVAFNEPLSLENIHSAVVHVGMLLRTELGLSVREELLEHIKTFCLHRPAIYTEKGMDGKTVQYLACASGDLELAKSFHQMGCTLCEQGNFFIDTPLHGAALHCHISVVVWLLSLGHPLNLLNKEGMSVFDSALCRTGFPDAKQKTEEQAQLCYKILQAAPTQAELSLSNAAAGPLSDDDTIRWGRQLRAGVHTDLHTAVISGDRPHLIETILRNAKQGDHVCQQLLDAPDPSKFTALHWAVVSGNDHAINRLLGATDASMRAKVDTEDRDGWTPLHMAVLLGRADVVSTLLMQNAERGKPFHMVRHVNFESAIWEDKADPSRYILRLHQQVVHHRKKDLIGPWTRTKEGHDIVLERSFSGTHTFKDGKTEDVVFKTLVKPAPGHQQGYRLLVCLTAGDAVSWWGVYDARTGLISKRCRGWTSTCHVNESGRCSVCGCRDVFPAGIRPSIELNRVTRGNQSPTALHAACTGAMLPLVHGAVASPCSGSVAEDIAILLLGSAGRLKNVRHKNFLLALDGNGNTAFSIVVRGLSVEYRTVKGAGFVRRFWGAEDTASLLASTSKDLNGLSAWEHNFKMEGCEQDWIELCQTSLEVCEQHIPAQLIISSKTSPQVSGVYDRMEFCGTNRWPEYRCLTSKHRTHTLKSDNQGRWAISKCSSHSSVVVAVSKPHGGMLPPYVRSWNSSDGSTADVEISHLEGTPTVPKEYEQLGWLMTLRNRCSDTIALCFIGALFGATHTSQASLLSLKSSWDYAVLNAAAMPGSKGDGDPRLIKESLSFHKAASKELLGSLTEDIDAEEEKGGETEHGQQRAFLEQTVALLSTSLHCAAIYGRRQTIRCLIGECSAEVDNEHLETAVVWERWDEAKELLDNIRSVHDVRSPFSVFSNGVAVDGRTHYDALPSLDEIKFCAENDVALPHAYRELLANHLNLLKRILSTDKNEKTMHKSSITWDAAPHKFQEILRYLLSVKYIDYAEVLKDPETRKSLNGFDFGSTPRSAELFLALSRVLSSQEVVSIVKNKGTKGLSAEWFTRGVTVAGVQIMSHDYCALRYPLHVLLVKTASPMVKEEISMTEEIIEFRKTCRLLLLECVRMVNTSAKHPRDNEDTIELACMVPRVVAYPLQVQVVPSAQGRFARKFFKKKKAKKAEETPGETNFSVPIPTTIMGGQRRSEDLNENQWCLLPIELAIELRLVDVLEQMLKGGVVTCESMLKGRNSSGDFIRFRGYRDIWFPRSAEYTEQPGGSAVELNWNRFSTQDGPPLLHRTLERLSVPIHSSNVDAMHESRVHKLPLESPQIPHLPPGLNEVISIFLPTEEREGDSDDKALRQMVIMLLKSSFKYKRDHFSKSVYVGEARSVEKAELVNTKKLHLPDSPTSAATTMNNAKTTDKSFSLGGVNIPSYPEDPIKAPPVQSSFTSAVTACKGKDNALNLAKVKSSRWMRSSLHKATIEPGGPDSEENIVEETDLTILLQHIGSCFDRAGVFAMGAKKWHEASLAAASAAVSGCLACIITAHVNSPFVVLMLLKAIAPQRKVQNEPELDVSDVILAKKKRLPAVTEFGLAKLLQRAPWVVHDSFPKIFEQILRSHPFLTANQLEKKMTSSSTPVYIERRHRWTRSLRHVLTSQNSKTVASYDLEAPGEQDQLKDDRLSLLHWLSLLNASTALRIMTIELGDAVMKQTKRKGTEPEPDDRMPFGDRETEGLSAGTHLAPTRKSKLGFTPLHYCAYSGSIDALTLLTEKAEQDCGDLGMKNLLNYQVRCICHHDLLWSQAADAAVHHVNILPTTGDTALMIASQFAHFHITQALLQAGASTHYRNHEQFDCHDIAIAMSFRAQCQMVGVSEVQALAIARAAEDDEEGEFAEGEDSDFGANDSQEAMVVINKQITTLNANDTIHKKLEGFAQKMACIAAMWYVLFLVLLVVVTFRITTYDSLTTEDRYWTAASVSNFIRGIRAEESRSELDSAVLPYINDFNTIGSLDDFKDWLKVALPGLLYNQTTTLNGACFENGLMGVYELIGAARVSVLRVEGRDCAREGLESECQSEDGLFFPKRCYPPYSRHAVNSTGVPDQTLNATWNTKDIYSFTSSTSYVQYDIGQGEVRDVAANDPEALHAVLEGDFLDPTVRLCSLLVSYYQPSVDIVVVGSFHVELLQSGLVVPSVEMVSMRVSDYEKWEGVNGFYAFLEASLLAFIVSFLLVEVIGTFDFVSRLTTRVYYLFKSIMAEKGASKEKVESPPEAPSPTHQQIVQRSSNNNNNNTNNSHNPLREDHPPKPTVKEEKKGVQFSSSAPIIDNYEPENNSSSCTPELRTQKTIESVCHRRDEEENEESQPYTPLDIESTLVTTETSAFTEVNYEEVPEVEGGAPKTLPPHLVDNNMEILCVCEDCVQQNSSLIMVTQLRAIKRWTLYFVAFWTILVKETAAWLLSSWNVIDLIMATLLAICAYLRIKIFKLSSDELSDQAVAGPGPIFIEGFLKIARSFTDLHLILGIVLMLSFIKVLRLIVIVPKMGPVIRAIIHTVWHRKVILFFILYIEVLVAFVLGLYVAFGAKLQSYHSIVQSLYLVLRIVLGDYPGVGGFDDLLSAHYVLGPLFYIFLMIFGQLLFLNILIAVVGEVYQKAAEATNRDWSKQISLMYQYEVCQRADPQEQPFATLFQGLQRRNKLPLFTLAQDSERVKSKHAHLLPWEVVGPSTVSAYAKQRRDEQLSLSQVETSLDKNSKLILSMLRSHHDAISQSVSQIEAEESQKQLL